MSDFCALYEPVKFDDATIDFMLAQGDPGLAQSIGNNQVYDAECPAAAE